MREGWEERREAIRIYYQSERMLIEAGFIPDNGEEEAIVWPAGKTDVVDFFEQSGIRSYAVLTHTPILAFVSSWLCGPDRTDGIQVRIIAKPSDLLTLHDAVKCMGQWQGEYRSDFFQFTVGQLRAHLTRHPKQAHQRI